MPLTTKTKSGVVSHSIVDPPVLQGLFSPSTPGFSPSLKSTYPDSTDPEFLTHAVVATLSSWRNITKNTTPFCWEVIRKHNNKPTSVAIMSSEWVSSLSINSMLIVIIVLSLCYTNEKEAFCRVHSCFGLMITSLLQVD